MLFLSFVLNVPPVGAALECPLLAVEPLSQHLLDIGPIDIRVGARMPNCDNR
jgi:hypothetical protein